MSSTQRSFLIPEVLQNSLMDCGPAALKAVLDGFGIPVRYDSLRERCQTDVDGTSIDALAGLAQEYGLESREVVLPRDHVFLPEARCLPAIVVTSNAAGLWHFVVVWRTWGPWVQILDPGSGRRWQHTREFLARMPDFPVPISTERWRRWAGGPNAARSWHARLRRLGLSRTQAEAALRNAAGDRSFRSFAALDAAMRMTAALMESGAVRGGARAARVLQAALESPDGEAPSPESLGIDRRFWWALEADAPPGKLILRGGVIVQFAARDEAEASRRSGKPCGTPPARQTVSDPAARSDGGRGVLPKAAQAVLEQHDASPLLLLWRIARHDAGGALWTITAAVLASALVLAMETLLLRGLLYFNERLSLEYQRTFSLLALAALAAAGLALDRWVIASTRRLGRQLEARLRVAFLEKLPRLEDHYIMSRPSSDMAGRLHSVHYVRDVPTLWAQSLRAASGLVSLTLGIAWIYPERAALIVALSALQVALTQLGRRSLAEANRRLRTHTTALDRFYLDALIGAVPIRVHAAERAVRAEHEVLLTEWARTAGALHGRNLAIQAVVAACSTAAALIVVGLYVAEHRALARILLLAFWALRLPGLASELAVAQQSLRNLRSIALRIMAPLAAVSAEPAPEGEPATSSPDTSAGAELRLENVSVQLGGHTVLQELSLEIPGGSHVALVGASGSGKSSLLGLFLGWTSAASGIVRVDGKPLDAAQLSSLRGQTSWIDPAVQLWAQSLFDNINFSADPGAEKALPVALSRADLLEVIEQLPEGMQSELGEGGARLSGGQGQRVRLGRALLRRDARLVLLDEPFRGLERARRRELMARIRAHWPRATILFISHDIEDTLDFDCVFVLENGRLVEHGSPRRLVGDGCSRYFRHLEAERALRSEMWSDRHWQRRSIREGRLVTVLRNDEREESPA